MRKLTEQEIEVLKMKRKKDIEELDRATRRILIETGMVLVAVLIFCVLLPYLLNNQL